MRRFTTLVLMCIIVIFAVCLAALRSGGEMWSGVMLLVTAISIGTGIIGSIIGPGRSRHGWLGFTIFAGGYLLLAFLDSDTSRLLITTQVLDSVSARVSYGDPETIELGNNRDELRRTLVKVESMNFADENRLSILKGRIGRLSREIEIKQKSAPMNPGGWKVLLPGASDYDNFLRIGHCMFALLSGVLGAVVARRVVGDRSVIS